MKNSKLFSCVSDILSLDSVFSLYVASCVTKALGIDFLSFVIALPSDISSCFVEKLKNCLEGSPITLVLWDDIPNNTSLLFIHGTCDSYVYLHFRIYI